MNNEDSNKETVTKIVATVLSPDGRGVNILLRLLIVLLMFSILALIPLWAAKKLNILPSPSITIDNGPSKTGISNVVEQERPLRLMDNVEIYSDVLTLDDLNFTPEEQKQLESFKTKYPRLSSKIDNLKSGFSIQDKFSSKTYPFQNTSFKRFNEVFKDALINKHLCTSERKAVFLSENYWEMINKGLNVYVFPGARQPSISVLRIFGAKSSGVLYTGVDRSNEEINTAIIKATGQRTITIPNEESFLYLCITSGEKITFESSNYSWTISVSNILNVPASRGDYDVTIIDWAVTELD